MATFNNPTPVTEMGHRAAAKSSSMLELKICDPCDDFPVCADRITTTRAATVKITGITVNGTFYPFVAGILVNNPVAITTALAGLFDAEPIREIDPHILVTYTGTSLFIEHFGAYVLESATFDTGADATATRICTTVQRCDYLLSVVDDAAALNVDGVEEALATGTYPWTGVTLTDTATAATLAADIEAALTALGITDYEVTVELNGPGEVYTVTIHTLGGQAIKIDGISFQSFNCKLYFD